MRICGIACSPRTNGNTEILVREVLSAARQQGAETELISVAGKKVAPCDACGACRQSGKCRLEDDLGPIYAAMLAADGIVFGTPVYFWGVSAQAKIIIDRTYAFRTSRLLRGKVAGLVVVARRGGTSSAFSTLANFVNLQRMHLAGGVTAYGRDKGDVLNDADGMGQAAALGKAMVRLLQSLR